MALDLPEVSQEWSADMAPYLAEMDAAIGRTDDLIGKIGELQGAIDALHGKDIDIGVDTTLAGMAAGATGASAETVAAIGRVENAVHDMAREAAIDSAVMIAAMNRVADAAADMAARTTAASAAAGAGTAAGWRVGIGWLRLTGTTLHWLLAGSAEFLAVFIPAMVAAGGAAAVMAEGVANAQVHLQAMYSAQEATANIFHTTTGQMVGMRDVLQQAQTAADPHVYELLGAGINIAKGDAGNFVSMGTKVVGVLDDFAAKITGELTGALGGKLNGLLSGGVRDLTAFGQVLGNVGHAVINLASDMPGLAEVLLGLLDGASRLLSVLSGVPGWIITVAMGFEEFNRWGSVVVSTFGHVTGATTSLQGGFFSLTRAGSVIQNLASVFVQGAARIVGGAGNVMTSLGQLWIKFGTGAEEIGAVEAEAIQMGGAMVNAGTAVSGFGARLTSLAESITPLQALIGIGLVAGLGYLIYRMETARTATQQFTDSLQHATMTASNLSVFQTIGGNLDVLATRAGGATSALHTLMRAGVTSGAAYSSVLQILSQLNAGMSQQQHDLGTAAQGVAYLSRTYGTTFVGALALANAANVHLAEGITGTGEAATVNRLKIANYVAGMQAMGENANTVGHDVTLLGIDSALSATKVQQLQQAFSDFVSNMAGGTNALASFEQSLTSLTKGANNVTTILGKSGSVTLSVKGFAEDLTRFTGQGAQAWQNFDSALTGSATQLVQWFQTAGAEGAVGAGKFTSAMQDIVAQFVPFAAKSKTAQAELVGFANAAGLSANSFPALVSQLNHAGASGKGLASIVEGVTRNMSNMNSVAQALGSSVGTDVVSAMNNARIAASGLGQSADNLASAWDHAHSVNSQVVSGFQQTYDSLMNVYHNTTMAKNAVDALAQEMGMSQGQISTLNHSLGLLAGEAGGAAGQVHGLVTAINGLQSKTVTITTYYRSVGQAGAIGGHTGTGPGGYAAGTDYAMPGPKLVGEFGPELMWFGGGEGVMSNSETRRFLAMGGAAGPGSGGGASGGPIHLHADITTTAMLDGREIWRGQQRETLVYNGRNGNQQSGRMAPGR